MEFLNNKYARVLTLVSLLQAIVFYAIARRPESPRSRAPVEFPAHFGDWHMIQDMPIEKEVAGCARGRRHSESALRERRGNQGSVLLHRLFKTQRTGQSPHSPKNCLPGSGWEPSNRRPAVGQGPRWPSPSG